MKSDIETNCGNIGVIRLHGFWERALRRRNGEFLPGTRIDQLMMDGLNVAREETLAYVMREAPSFPEFEQWILDKNDGNIDPLDIERLNCVTEGASYGENLRRSLNEVDEAEPVLSPDDLKFWDEHGYVIVRNAVTREAAKKSEDAVWQFLGMEREKPESWYSKPIGKGIMTEFYHHETLNANRRSKRIRKAFAQLWNTSDLFATTDRAGFNPPENKLWMFPGPNMHWDMELTPPFKLDIQGILYLCDTPAEQGAFSCVPGFQKRLEEWIKENPDTPNPPGDDLQKQAIPIAANAGDMVIWHHFLPHGSSPNRGKYPRVVQYLTMAPPAF
jgi:hypothetical protein